MTEVNQTGSEGDSGGSPGGLKGFPYKKMREITTGHYSLTIAAPIVLMCHGAGVYTVIRSFSENAAPTTTRDRG